MGKKARKYVEENYSIDDHAYKWEDAYRKVSPFIQSEKDFEQKMRNMELAIAGKKLADTGAGGDITESDLGTYALSYKNGEINLSGIPIKIRAEAKRLADNIVKVQGQWVYKPTGENLGGVLSSSKSDYSTTQKQDLELEFGKDWKTATNREQQLEFLRGEDDEDKDLTDFIEGK